MAYTAEWTPTAVDITKAQTIRVTTWDGQTVPELTYFISGNALVVTVPRPNKYKITIFSGSDQETTRIYIPEPSTQPESALELRLYKYIDDVIAQHPSAPGGTINIKPDPDREGYFIATTPEETV